jgi:hypothetical protein
MTIFTSMLLFYCKTMPGCEVIYHTDNSIVTMFTPPKEFHCQRKVVCLGSTFEDLNGFCYTVPDPDWQPKASIGGLINAINAVCKRGN